MGAVFFSSAGCLRPQDNYGYGPMPIPQPRDEEISSLLRKWTGLDQSSQNAALAGVSEACSRVLLAYSERMASLAVRDRNGEHIALGLLALGLDGWRYDCRENIVLLALHYDAAQRIRANPADLFKLASRWLPEEPANGLRSFLERSPEDKSLEAMGYVVGADEDGFRYQRTW